MQSTIEKLEGMTHKLKVNIPAEEVTNAYNNHLKEAAKQIHLKGFRPGKVPENVIKQRFGSGLEQETLQELIQTSFREAIEKHKINFAGQPDIKKPGKLVPGEAFSYEATFEMLPEINLHDLSGISVEKVTAEITDDDIARMLKSLQEQNADWALVQRPAQKGDRVKIDFDGKIDNVAIERGSAKDIYVVLGSQQMIPGFEDGIIGMKSEETRDIKVTFPQAYGEQKYSGKEAVFKITLHSVEEPKLLGLDQALPEKLHIKGGYEALKKEVRKQMQESLNQAINARLQNVVLDKLLEQNPINLPKSLVRSEVRYLQMNNQAQHEMMQKRYNQNIPMPNIPEETYVKEAERRVHLGLLMAEVIKRFKIERDQNKIYEKVRQLAKNYPNPDVVAKNYLQNKNLMAEIEASISEEQVVAKLLENAKIELKTVSYEEAIQPPKE